MVRALIGWALDSPLIVLLIAVALAGFGVFAFIHVNVEAYPDPAPAIIEVVAPYNGASAEEIERQVTVPLEVTLAGMPGLKYVRSKSLFGLSHLRIQFEYGVDYNTARQEVINRLQFTQPLPAGVSPSLSPESPTGEIFRYTLASPKDVLGRDIYTLNDLKAMQDWVLEREFRRVPRIVDVSSSGGTIRTYEIQPDPDRLRRYGVTLAQVQAALGNSNASVGGGNISQGAINQAIRSVALFGGGEDPVRKVIGMKDPDPAAAAELLEAEKARRRKFPSCAKPGAAGLPRSPPASCGPRNSAAFAKSAAWSLPLSTTSPSVSRTSSRAAACCRAKPCRIGASSSAASRASASSA